MCSCPDFGVGAVNTKLGYELVRFCEMKRFYSEFVKVIVNDFSLLSYCRGPVSGLSSMWVQLELSSLCHI